MHLTAGRKDSCLLCPQDLENIDYMLTEQLDGVFKRPTFTEVSEVK